METSHDELKDNTIIVGERHCACPKFTRLTPHSPWRLWRSRKEKGMSVLSRLPGRCALSVALQTFPALFGLYRQGFLPRDVKIVGYARTKMDQDEFYKRQTSYIKNPDDDPELTKSIEAFKGFSSYVSGGYDDGESFDKLNKYLEEIESKYQSKERNRIFYLALPPSVFISVAKNLKEHCYVAKHGVNRIIIEKPFGKDLETARELLGTVKQYWTEDETFRIDHYLGKEMVKNLLVLRFANIAMGAAWDKNSISNVQITFKEPFGTEGRGGYFDEFGIVRDILQNRQSLSLSISLRHHLHRRLFGTH
jgi:glucose-6-phosphate 1-dehydrogenase